MPEVASSLRPNGRPVVLTAGAAVAGMLVAAAGAMWVYYGSAVFFEMMVAGFQACF